MIPKEHGYKSVKDFNNKYAVLLEKLTTAEKEDQANSKSKKSIRSRIAENKEKAAHSNKNKLPMPAYHGKASL